MTTFLFVLFTIPFFISAPFYTANIPQVARFVNNNLLGLKAAKTCNPLPIYRRQRLRSSRRRINRHAGRSPPRRFRRRTIQNASRRRFLKNKRFIKKALVFASAFFDLVFAVCQAYSQSSISVTVNGGSMCVEM